MSTSLQESGASTKAMSQGIVFIVLAMLMLPGIDALAKLVSGSISAGQAAWARFFFQVIILAPFVLWQGQKIWNRTIWLHAARGGLIAIATLLFFMALKVMPLADAIAIFFVQPFIVTLLAAAILGEAFGWRRMMAIAIGFVGALFIIKPSYESFGLTALLPVGTAFCFALYVVLARKLSRTVSPLPMQFLAGVFGLLTMSMALVIGYAQDIQFVASVWPTYTEWQLLALLGIVATLGHVLVVMAYSRAPVAVLAPFQYLEIVSATLLGYVVFDDLPDLLTIIGISIIVSCGLFVFYREIKLSRWRDRSNTVCVERE
ncbi:MAG: DMT family transporter [Hyphomicrobiaceae bacterium]